MREVKLNYFQYTGEEKEEEEDESALQWESIAGCFYVLLGGIGIATLLAIFEFIWNVKSISVESKVDSKGKRKIVSQ